jgi:hypothetical protein
LECNIGTLQQALTWWGARTTLASLTSKIRGRPSSSSANEPTNSHTGPSNERTGYGSNTIKQAATLPKSDTVKNSATLQASMSSSTKAATSVNAECHAAPAAAVPQPELALSPGERLVGTTELLEHILLYLPLRELLFANRVAKRFALVTKGSQKIRQALYFEPLPPDGRSIQSRHSDISAPLVVPNPLLVTQFLDDNDCHHIYQGYKHKFWALQGSFMNAFRLLQSPKSASWRGMYLFQPLDLTLRIRSSSTSKDICLSNGLSMDELVKECSELTAFRQTRFPQRFHIESDFIVDSDVESIGLIMWQDPSMLEDTCGWDMLTPNRRLFGHMLWSKVFW